MGEFIPKDCLIVILILKIAQGQHNQGCFQSQFLFFILFFSLVIPQT